MDGAPVSSIRVATNKAWTAARERKPTKEIGEKVKHPEKGHDIAYYGDPQYVGWGGGIPVWKNGEVVGAVAVSGLSSNEDIALATLGVELIVAAKHYERMSVSYLQKFRMFQLPCGHNEPALALGQTGERASACSCFVTQFTFSRRERNLMQNSSQLRGMSGSEGLSALRRYRICCQACGHQWQVRRHRIYPSEVPGLRRQWTEKLDSTYNTAG